MKEEINAFLEELNALMKKHNISISHEDQHGGFILQPYSERNFNWLCDAEFVPWTPESNEFDYDKWLEDKAEEQRKRGLIA